MNVFENLIEELKQENLIEETVIETSREPSARQDKKSEFAPAARFSAEESPAPGAEIIETSDENNQEFLSPQEFFSTGEKTEFFESAEAAPELASLEADETGNAEPDSLETTSETLNILPPLKTSFAEQTAANPVAENEFFRRRAMEEVTSLQIVEHIISGVEREQMKVLPKTFNDIAVSKALHDFLQISKNGSAQENAQAEFKLMQETESWYSALSHRDKNISVGELRRYCETTKPALSPQALTALARFYRNSPYSENVRVKFDMVATRLLTKEIEGEKRALSFERDELIAYLGELYASWSSIPLYAPNDDSEILIATLKFEDFMNEAEAADNFEELVKTNFFDRLRIFKESAGENFYAPLVTATAIESNVRVGNRWVDLIRSAREKTDAALIEEKYGLLLDQTVSDVMSKSVQLGELLKEKKGKAPLNEKKEKLSYGASSAADRADKAAAPQSRLRRLLALNKWLLAALILTVLLSGSMIVWVDFMTPQTKPSPNVKKVNLENSSLKDDLKAARISAEIFYGVVQPTWNTMPAQKKEELVRKLQSVGGEKGYKEVQLMNDEGKTVAYASDKTVNISSQ